MAESEKTRVVSADGRVVNVHFDPAGTRVVVEGGPHKVRFVSVDGGGEQGGLATIIKIGARETEHHLPPAAPPTDGH